MLYFSRLKIGLIFFTIIFGIYFSLPNFFQKNVSFLSSQKVILGLDLQGGSYILLEVDSKPLFEQRFQIKTFEIRKELRKKRIFYKNFRAEKNTIEFEISPNESKQIEELFKSNLINQSYEDGTREFNYKKIDNKILIEFNENFLKRITKSAVEQSLEIIRTRVDQLGTKEPNIVSQGEDRILVELPGIDDPKEIKEIIGKTAKLNFKFLAESDAKKDTFQILKSRNSNEKFNIDKKVMLSGEHLTDAQPGFDNLNNQSVVNFKLDNFGAKKFAYATKNNIGRRLAIIIDDEVVSAPVIRDAITSGNGQISGSFSVNEANNLAIVLRSGALPAPLNIIEERTVGPDLGQESINKGVISLLIGFVLVIIYIGLNYKLFGLFANVSLLLNLILLLAILSFLEATLTLPGIAGIILTVGMAVDANILIYERIKEELKLENNLLIAFDNGYKRVLTTLLDANITTLIAAFVLYFIGSGPIKGFAITLAIGIVSSLFTTFVFGRFLVSVYIKSMKGKKIVL